MNLLFVCSGTPAGARSEVARKIAIAAEFGPQRVELGTNAGTPPATDEALLVGTSGSGLTGHRARKQPLRSYQADSFVMTPGHLDPVKQMCCRGKHNVIDEYSSRSPIMNHRSIRR